MTEDELNELYLNPEGAVNRDYTLLFYVFSVGSGMTFDELNAMLGYSFSAEYAREIGKVGNYTFYLYMDGPDQDFAETIGPAYRDEYLALAGAPEQVGGSPRDLVPKGEVGSGFSMKYPSSRG